MHKLLARIANAILAASLEDQRAPRRDESWRDLTIGLVIR